MTESSDGTHPVGPGNRYLNNLTFGNRRGEGDAEPEVSGAVARGHRRRHAQQRPGPGRGAPRYGLRATSPAVDAGTRDGAPRHDFDGTPRPRGGGVDIGPHELPAK